MEQTTEKTATLYIALDLGSTKWTLASSSSRPRKPRCRDVAAGDLGALELELQTAKKKFGLPANCAVKSCFEAGRDGFWLHRHLHDIGIDNVVIDPGSMAVPRKRRAKTDRIDARLMLDLLLRHHEGESVWSVVHVPSKEVEDERRAERERERLTKDRTSLRNQIFSVLATCGVPRPKHPPEQIASLLDYLEHPLAQGAKRQLERLKERLALVETQLEQIGTERKQALAEAKTGVAQAAKKLSFVKGIGELSAYALSLEGLGWRQFRNTREVGGSSGLVPVPHLSDQGSRDLGVSKAARPKLRSLLVQLAWLWLRYQPNSALTRWFHERFSQGKRSRRIGIVALARKLYIALWKYLTWGQIPEGATVRA